tara:strand:- start:865 stop:2217 length:1353 start_codon:yes stop_codon:yes gene_type:complete
MASSYSNRLKIELIGDGEQSGSWGDTTNNNLGASAEGGVGVLDHAIAGVLSISTGSDTTLTLSDNDGPQTQANNQARQASLVFTGASADCVVTVPARQKVYNVHNTNTGNTITLRLSGTSTDYVVAASSSALVSTTGSAWHALSPGSFTAGGTISNTSGDITIDAVGDIILDADNADIFLKDAGTTFGSLTNTSGDLIIKSGTTTAATFSGANVTFAGTIASGAIDNGSSNITSGGLLKLDVDADADDLTGDSATGRLTIGAGEDLNLYHGGTNSYIVNDTGDLIIDTEGDITLDADGDNIRLKANGTEFGQFVQVSSNLEIHSSVQDKDIIFKGNDGGATITALTLDMSADGAATFKNDVTAFSDERLKTDIKTIDNALSKVCDMRGVYFNRDGAAGTGVIAQEIQNVLPEVVHDKQEYLSVAYGNMVGVLIEAIKELKKEVETLKESK